MKKETNKSTRKNGKVKGQANRGLLLSPRELQAILLIAGGNSSKQIADELTISEDTVESHRRNILRKLGAGNMTEAVACAFRNKLIR